MTYACSKYYKFFFLKQLGKCNIHSEMKLKEAGNQERKGRREMEES